MSQKPQGRNREVCEVHLGRETSRDSVTIQVEPIEVGVAGVKYKVELRGWEVMHEDVLEYYSLDLLQTRTSRWVLSHNFCVDIWGDRCEAIRGHHPLDSTPSGPWLGKSLPGTMQTQNGLLIPQWPVLSMTWVWYQEQAQAIKDLITWLWQRDNSVGNREALGSLNSVLQASARATPSNEGGCWKCRTERLIIICNKLKHLDCSKCLKSLCHIYTWLVFSVTTSKSKTFEKSQSLCFEVIESSGREQCRNKAY